MSAFRIILLLVLWSYLRRDLSKFVDFAKMIVTYNHTSFRISTWFKNALSTKWAKKGCWCLKGQTIPSCYVRCTTSNFFFSKTFLDCLLRMVCFSLTKLKLGVSSSSWFATCVDTCWACCADGTYNISNRHLQSGVCRDMVFSGYISPPLF